MQNCDIEGPADTLGVLSRARDRRITTPTGFSGYFRSINFGFGHRDKAINCLD